MTWTDEGSGWGATSENEGTVVEEAGAADAGDDGTTTDEEDETSGVEVGAASDVTTTSTDVAGVDCSTAEVEYGTPS